MNRAALIGACLLMLIVETGCSTLTVVRNLNDQRFATDAQPVAHVSARVGGVYLFNFIPLVTGSAQHPNTTRVFQNETDVDRVVNMVTRTSKELGATRLTDLYSWSDSAWMVPTLVFWYRWTSVSANASAIPAAAPGSPATPRAP